MAGELAFGLPDVQYVAKAASIQLFGSTAPASLTIKKL